MMTLINSIPDITGWTAVAIVASAMFAFAIYFAVMIVEENLH